ncbi:hypothetical protein [Streptomyces nanshensis]|uniref:hypothetical protein n=1 Tax=Streptomyces nanshensis TaxID=518642 RepID=UPI00085CB656|nr:hypothetical protein [Streptomyces nanshensis]
MSTKKTTTKTSTVTVAATRMAPEIPWPTLSVAELVEATAHLPEADTELVADIQANAIYDPLYVGYDAQGKPRLYDGRERLAAAAAAGFPDVPVTYRPVVRRERLSPHPKNVREDLDLNDTFIESLKVEGCRIPVLIQRLEGDVLQVNEGNRRWYGAEPAGLTHLPYAWEEHSEAEQFLGMISTAEHRADLSPRAKAQALFHAVEGGAGAKKAAAASGMSQKQVKAVAAVGASTTAQTVAPSWGFDDLELLHNLEQKDPDEAARIAAEHRDDPDEANWQLSRTLKKFDQREKAEAQRAELEKNKARIFLSDELGDNAEPLYRLWRTVEDEEEHAATCQGHAYVLVHPDADHYTAYCTNAVLFGHITEADQQTPASAAQTKADRNAVIDGNIDWDTATTDRRTWLRDLIGRPTHTKAQADHMTELITLAMLGGNTVLSEELTGNKTGPILADLLGQDEKTARAEVMRKAATRDPKRRPALMFAVLAAAYESKMDRKAWRTDSQRNPWVRAPAAAWLRELCERFGYKPRAIEASVRDGEPYQPHAEEPQTETVD